jgi:hypothetical protein
MPTPQTGADYYLEVGFNGSAGSFAAGSSIVIQARFAKTNNSNYDQNNDYSFNNYASNYVDWTKVTAYIGGVQVWGQEPGSSYVPSSAPPTYTSVPSNSSTPVPVAQRSAFTRLEAESYNSLNSSTARVISVPGGSGVGYIYNGTYIVYNRIDFANGAIMFKAFVATSSSTNIEVRIDSPSGINLCTLTATSTGSFDTYQERSCGLGNVSGVHDLYLVFTGSVNIDWFMFVSTNSPTKIPTSTHTSTPTQTPTKIPTKAPTIAPSKSPTPLPTYTKAPTSAPTYTRVPTRTPVPTATYTKVPTHTRVPTSTPTNTRVPTATPTPLSQISAFTTIEAEDYDGTNSLSIKKVGTADGGYGVGYIENGNYLLFKGVNFGSGAYAFKALVASGTNASIQIRLGSVSGTLAGTLSVTQTGDWNIYREQACNLNTVTGVYDLYIVFTGAINIDWLTFTSSSLPAPTMKNIALRKMASSDSQSTSYKASYAVDGNTSTRWCAANGNPNHYLQLDLGGFYNIAGTEINWKKRRR